ncbi:hypothetical protein D918_10064 [Trichuris suis]|nr:hypothetical protein D918_10064 [Trichuris suis]
MNGVKALGGVLVDSRGRARFGPSEGTAGAAKEVDITLEEPDFIVTFDHAKQSWTIAWKWRNGKGPDVLKNVVREYPPMTEARGLYEEELRTWIEQGWLVPYAEKGRIWVDASGIAIGVAVEIGGSIVEDATWLHPNDACHINKAELDAVIRGLNLALAWGLKAVELMTDSATVHRWVFDGISGKAGLKTKAAGEMLIRRRIDTILSLVQELRGVNRPVREKPHEHCSCDIGDCVWVKPPATRCNSRYQRGVVIGIVSEHAVEVDGIPRHIRDLRRRAPSENSAGECTTEGPESGPIMALPARLPTVIKTMWTAATADTRTNGIQQRDDGAKTMATLTSEEADVRRPSRTGIGRQCILCD